MGHNFLTVHSSDINLVAIEREWLGESRNVFIVKIMCYMCHLCPDELEKIMIFLFFALIDPQNTPFGIVKGAAPIYFG